MIRKATKDDYPLLVRFGKRFYSHTDYTDVPFDDDSALWWFDLMASNGALLVGEINGKPVGAAGSLYSPMLTNMAYRVGQECFWWIDPEFRGTGVGRELLRGLEAEARTAGVYRWSMVCLESLEPERVASLYLRAGYSPTERTFTKVLS